MDLSDADILAKLGSGETIESVSDASGLGRDEFDAWWQSQTASRLPSLSGTKEASVEADVEVLRDKWGIPHIFAGNDEDLFFGFGLAMAQDRLWQLDYYRRRATGRLAEVLGEEALDEDVLVRTVGINRIAASQVTRLPAETLRRLEAFSAGINSVTEDSRDKPPIEFGLLDYSPEPWAPVDSVAVWAWFRWYLTGRLGVIYNPEMAARALGDDALLEAFFAPEAGGHESILPEGSYPSARGEAEKVGGAVGGPDDWAGSNNWVVGGGRTASGRPIVASDPHIAIGSVSCWYEVHLSGGPFNVTGTAYVGVPVIIFGRSERVGWGLTNNICSQRDLYREKTDAERPGQFLYNGQWEPSRELTEEIAVKGRGTVTKTVVFSRNGPIVDELVPPLATKDGPLSMRWLGQDFSDEISCYHAAYQARNCDEFREALRGWLVPTLSLAFGDVEGHIGYQCVGRIPIREGWERGFRRGWDPADQWRELVPFDGMPALSDPPQDWIRSANNRTAPEDYPYPLSGTWPVSYRAMRIRQMLEDAEGVTHQDVARMQMDTLALRAVDSIPALLKLLSGADDARVREAVSHLESWDRRMEPDSVGATIFHLFSPGWGKALFAQRMHGEYADALGGSVGALGTELLSEDRHGWMTSSTREEVALSAMNEALDRLTELLGLEMSGWTWGRLHTGRLKHLLESRGDLGQLLNREGGPVPGSGDTVCSTGPDADFKTAGGSNYRLVADMSDSPPGLWASDAAGQSGHPGSPNYCDQLADWSVGRPHYLPMDRERAEAGAVHRLRLRPGA